MTESSVKGERSYVVGRLVDLPPGSVTIVPKGKFGIGVFNVDGNFYALVNYCLHRGGPVCTGKLKDKVDTTEEPDGTRVVRTRQVLRCPWHGWGFEIESGRRVGFSGMALRTYPVSIRDGLVVLTRL